jgi:hypothetical protein
LPKATLQVGNRAETRTLPCSHFFTFYFPFPHSLPHSVIQPLPDAELCSGHWGSYHKQGRHSSCLLGRRQKRTHQLILWCLRSIFRENRAEKGLASLATAPAGWSGVVICMCPPKYHVLQIQPPKSYTNGKREV